MVYMGKVCACIARKRERGEGREEEEERVKEEKEGGKEWKYGKGSQKKGEKKNLVHSLACLKPGQR